jgi:hypothetical protein
VIDRTPTWNIRTERWANDWTQGLRMVRCIGRQGHSTHPDDPPPHQNDSPIGLWEDAMATCIAHLRTALSAIEELSLHPKSSPSDAYFYDQASGSVWVTLVALDACAPQVPDQI